MRKRGKKILDIKWEKDGVKLKIPVHAVTDYDSDKCEDVMRFTASRENPPIDVQNTDINVVRKAVLSALNDWYSVRWEIWMMVTISGGWTSQGFRGEGCKVICETEFYAIGEDVRGKTRHMRIPKPKQFDKLDKEPMRWSGSMPMDGLPETGEELDGHFDGNETKSLVRATVENVSAAEGFVEAMEKLLAKMHHHFSPKRIEKLLAKSGQLLLGQVTK